ncbi:hypothetical protein TEHN7126_1997 [Tetragenococcus halophilus subsp. halophilus]|uniref:SHOCT domain-containing protein n=1 Tax=Tetragenococcus halophilus TaxID=51669 RepID=UPI000CB0D91C|nr:SHOCT domain-containing protein [Tetragenococcus halophilus]GBD73878.1 hypothetical protein TEHN7125_2038 [Tetragenococcus halophilus subsp. halophilus]GBD76298.1 hypothetical protein TEHN7126_1997 [Tetragenococcus halophilus subsp. halophilus]
MGFFVKDEREKELIQHYKENSALKVQNDKLVTIYFSDEDQKVFVPKSRFLDNQKEILRDYSELQQYREILDDMQETKKHGITRAVAGGLIAGPAGAIVGASTGGKAKKAVEKMAVALIFKDGTTFTINLIDKKTKTKSMIYKQKFEELLKLEAKLDSILASQKQETVEKGSNI